MHRPRVKPAIFRSQVRRPNHYTTKLSSSSNSSRSPPAGRLPASGRMLTNERTNQPIINQQTRRIAIPHGVGNNNIDDAEKDDDDDDTDR